MTDQEIIELLTESGALMDGHFRLSSGLHSAQYLQCAVALQHPTLAEKLGRELAERWRATAPRQISAVVSPALGGVIIGHEVGRALGTRASFSERVDGEMTLRRGFVLGPGLSVLVVEDVVTTGRSTLETVEAIRFCGAEPVGVACIANRSGKDNIDGLPLVSLIALDSPTFEADDCPQCEAREPIQKPGSRPVPA
ncbi:MAG: orotate phosphoribosyltransferase [Acidobacteria bacterium]|nr:orotate phosphoribosyltransferase [Acidobacteriota bacterium]